MSPVKKVRGDARFLNIQGTPVKKAPVQVVASYSGEIGPEVLGEFKRRYGYMDYVVLQKRTADGPSGRVYAWKDGSLGANAGLAAAKPGAKGTVLVE